jgi:TctA family transporter
MWKEIIGNDKFVAMFFVTIICCWAMYKMGIDAKDIIVPSITGMFGVVTGVAIRPGSTSTPPPTKTESSKTFLDIVNENKKGE